MSEYKIAGLALCLLGAACASAPQTARGPAIVNPYDYYAFDNLSRIEIAERLEIKSATLEGNAALLSASADGRMMAHERVASEPPKDSDRLLNKMLSGGGRSLYVQAQNTFEQDGWAIEGDRLRHVESGLLCPSNLALGEAGRSFSLERVIEFSEDGRDVACHYSALDNGDAITAYASYWPDVEVEAHAVAAAQGILQNYSVESQVSLPIIEVKADEMDPELAELVNGLEEPLAGGFEIGAVNGVSYRTSLWLVKTHGWHVKLRATYASADQSSELLSAIHFLASHLAVRAKNLAQPITPGAEV